MGSFDMTEDTAVRFAELIAAKSNTKFDKQTFLENFRKGAASKAENIPEVSGVLAEKIAKFKRGETRKYYPMSLFTSEDIKHFTFEKWNANTPARKAVGVSAFMASKQLAQQNSNYVFVGPAGTGKTALAVAVMNKLADVKSIMFVNLVALRSTMLASIDDERAKQDYNLIIRGMKEVELLVMDDFGKESGAGGATDKMTEILYSIVNARIGKSTIVTTNDNLSQLRSKYDESLTSRLIPKDEQKIVLFKDIDDYREA